MNNPTPLPPALIFELLELIDECDEDTEPLTFSLPIWDDVDSVDDVGVISGR